MSFAKVMVYHSSAKRSQVVCDAMAKGIRATGQRVRTRHEARYVEPKGEVAVFYGLHGNLRKIWMDYRRDGRKAVYIDLGYWGRREGRGRWNGYHKFAINGRHPTPYFQNTEHSAGRFRRFNLHVEPWQRRGQHILLAGMSEKAARVEGFGYLQWEKQAIKELRKYTKRTIVYRPKPGQSHRTDKIDGTRHSGREEKLLYVLRDCHATVTHHSNVSIDGLIAGVPSFCVEGVAAPLSRSNLSKIERPIYPSGREQLLWDIAWCQFSVAEMAIGVPWKHMMDEGLLE